MCSSPSRSVLPFAVPTVQISIPGLLPTPTAEVCEGEPHSDPSRNISLVTLGPAARLTSGIPVDSSEPKSLRRCLIFLSTTLGVSKHTLVSIPLLGTVSDVLVEWTCQRVTCLFLSAISTSISPASDDYNASCTNLRTPGDLRALRRWILSRNCSIFVFNRSDWSV